MLCRRCCGLNLARNKYGALGEVIAAAGKWLTCLANGLLDEAAPGASNAGGTVRWVWNTAQINQLILILD